MNKFKNIPMSKFRGMSDQQAIDYHNIIMIRNGSNVDILEDMGFNRINTGCFLIDFDKKLIDLALVKGKIEIHEKRYKISADRDCNWYTLIYRHAGGIVLNFSFQIDHRGTHLDYLDRKSFLKSQIDLFQAYINKIS